MKETKKLSERRRLLRTRRRITLIFAAVAALVLVWFFALCRIGTVTVEGCVRADADKLVSESGLSTGSHVYAINKGKIASRLSASDPYVASVTVRRKLPKTLRLIVTEYCPAYYVEQNGRILVLSPDLSVLEIRDDVPSYEGTARLLLPGAFAYAVGETLAPEDPEAFATVREILTVLEASELAGSLTEIDLREKFDVKVLYKNLYTVVFGSYRGIENKLALCIRTIFTLENDVNLQNQTGVLTYRDENHTSFLPTGTVTN